MTSYVDDMLAAYVECALWSSTEDTKCDKGDDGMGVQVAYKFTKSGRRSRYGVTDYPAIGEWSEARVPILCRSGWHVPVLLSEWIGTELWKVEVEGKSDVDDDKEAFEYVRFVEKVEDWNPDMMRDFIVHCCGRAAYADAYAAADAAYADADDAYADAYAAAYAAAYADAYADAYAYAYAAAAARRRYQHNWIVGRLNLGRGMEVAE